MGRGTSRTFRRRKILNAQVPQDSHATTCRRRNPNNLGETMIGGNAEPEELGAKDWSRRQFPPIAIAPQTTPTKARGKTDTRATRCMQEAYPREAATAVGRTADATEGGGWGGPAPAGALLKGPGPPPLTGID